MTKHIKLQKDYTSSCLYYQIKLPLDIEKNIPSDDPVRLLSAFVEGMELLDLYNTYGKIKKDQVSPRQLLKIVIYAGMNRIYSSRDIEKSCRRDINFMYLLEGKPSPDHATIARFISLHLSQCSSNILAEVSNILYELGEISGRHIFIDGTKIESAANRYTFVWKKAVTKNQTKLFAKITELIAECEEMYGLKLVYQDSISLHSLKRIRKKLYAIKESEGITFVHGIGRRKSAIQKSIESLEMYIGKLKEYIHKLYVCGERKIIFLLRLTGRQHSSNGNTVKHGWILLLFVSLYITKRSEDVLQWGKRKNIKKFMINGELVIEWKKEKSIKDVVGENICYD